MSTYTKNWEKRFDEMFPCRHHAAQCSGDCNDKIKDFLRRELEDARREVIERVEKLSVTRSRRTDDGLEFTDYLSIDPVALAKLKEETK